MTAALDFILFALFPYVAAAFFVVESLRRYLQRPFTYSSLASQFLENQYQFWGSVPFHYGLLTVLAGHLAAFLAPRWLLLWNGRPLRLYLLEAAGFGLGITALVGLVNLVVRRLTHPRVKVATSAGDWALLSLLVLQVLTGTQVALIYPWGSSWFASSVAPYLWSVLKLRPEIAYVSPMPLLVKLHVLGFFLILCAFPFTRLVHVLVFPLNFLWRPPQVARWNGPREKIAA